MAGSEGDRFSPMTQMQFSLSQTFPFPGKRGLKREASERDALAAGKQVLDKRLQIAAAVRAAWWQLAYLDHAIEIVQQNQGLMRDFIEIAQTKYKVGKGLQQDVLLAQLELSRLLNRLIPLKGMRSASQADLNTLMNRPANQPVRLPGTAPNINLPELPSETELMNLALGVRPILDVERERVEAARLRMDVAKKDSYPDFKLGAAYGFRDATDATGRDLPDLALRTVARREPQWQHRSGDRRLRSVSPGLPHMVGWGLLLHLCGRLLGL